MHDFFENPVYCSDEEARSLDASQLRAIASKCDDGTWVATAYIDKKEKIIVMSISYGKNPKKVVKDVLRKALKLLEKNVDIVD